ncbi:hypothetical protein E0K83_09525 [Gramella sp. BOM4]|nr:hypothetical protein [Christiangramia bathymodioli]
MKILMEQIHFTQLELENRAGLKVFSMGQAKRERFKNRKINQDKVRSKRFRDKKELIVAYSGKSIRQLKNIAPEEFLLIKEEIRRKARRESQKIIFIWTLIGIFILFLLLWL